MGGHGYFSDNCTKRSTHYVGALVNPPNEAEDVQDCGCYTLTRRSESDRVWVTYEYITEIYCLCVAHLKIHKDEEERKRIEEEEDKRIWEDRCIRAKPAAEKEKEKLITLMEGLKLHRLRDIKSIPGVTEDHNSFWDCKIYRVRGYVTMCFNERHSRFCVVRDEHIEERVRKGRVCTCRSSNLCLQFDYTRQGGKYGFKFVR